MGTLANFKDIWSVTWKIWAPEHCLTWLHRSLEEPLGDRDEGRIPPHGRGTSTTSFRSRGDIEWVWATHGRIASTSHTKAKAAPTVNRSLVSEVTLPD
jgi:hypothetical protein